MLYIIYMDYGSKYIMDIQAREWFEVRIKKDRIQGYNYSIRCR